MPGEHHEDVPVAIVNPFMRLRDWVRTTVAHEDVAINMLIYLYGLTVVW